MKKPYPIIIILGMASLAFISYLAYTAYKVRQLSDTILVKFHEYEESFNKANQSLNSKNEALVAVLGDKQARGHRVMVISDSFRTSIDSLNNELRESHKGLTQNQVNELQAHVNKTAEQMLAQLESTINRDSIKLSCDLLNADQEMIQKYLMDAPLPGQMAMLTKIRNDCMTLESDILQALAKGVK